MSIKQLQIDSSLVHIQNKLGESPVWSGKEEALYWTDIEEQLIFRFDPATGQFSSFELNHKVGSFALSASGGFVLAVENGFAFWDGKSAQVETEVITIPPNSACMMNDGKVDPVGRFWAGSKGPKGQSSLWHLGEERKFVTAFDGLGISNGLDWEHDRFYFTDSADARIYCFDYDLKTGEISNKRIFYESKIGVPDGLTLDSEGNIWTAIWDGWKVLQLSPEGKLMQEIRLPVQRPTSVCFGGKGLKTLFITSASTELDPVSLSKQPLAGDLFSIELEIPGRPMTLYQP